MLNLYGTETGGFGPPDVTVVGAVKGNIRGTRVVDTPSHIVFVKTATPLAPTRTPHAAQRGQRGSTGVLITSSTTKMACGPANASGEGSSKG